jgi:hypothetical protein
LEKRKERESKTRKCIVSHIARIVFQLAQRIGKKNTGENNCIDYRLILGIKSFSLQLNSITRQLATQRAATKNTI